MSMIPIRTNQVFMSFSKLKKKNKKTKQKIYFD